jgi:hypothetical protein
MGIFSSRPRLHQRDLTPGSFDVILRGQRSGWQAKHVYRLVQKILLDLGHSPPEAERLQRLSDAIPQVVARELSPDSAAKVKPFKGSVRR